MTFQNQNQKEKTMNFILDTMEMSTYMDKFDEYNNMVMEKVNINGENQESNEPMRQST